MFVVFARKNDDFCPRFPWWWSYGFFPGETRGDWKPERWALQQDAEGKHIPKKKVVAVLWQDRNKSLTSTQDFTFFSGVCEKNIGLSQSCLICWVWSIISSVCLLGVDHCKPLQQMIFMEEKQTRWFIQQSCTPLFRSRVFSPFFVALSFHCCDGLVVSYIHNVEHDYPGWWF